MLMILKTWRMWIGLTLPFVGFLLLSIGLQKAFLVSRPAGVLMLIGLWALPSIALVHGVRQLIAPSARYERPIGGLTALAAIICLWLWIPLAMR